MEQSAGCFILTAQEKPENARKMREDLFKKTMSADGIAGRRPYGMSTRMIELVGWKRYEVNSMVRFSGVTEKTFPSAHRRGFVWLPKARFIDGNFIANQYPDASMDGYFAKDDDLKSFLRSGPCVAASLRLQHAFESTHDAQACRDLIEAYAAKPLTEDAMREACGLPLRQRSDQVHANINLPVDKSSQDERDQLHEQLKNLLPAVMEHCLERACLSSRKACGSTSSCHQTIRLIWTETTYGMPCCATIFYVRLSQTITSTRMQPCLSFPLMLPSVKKCTTLKQPGSTLLVMETESQMWRLCCSTWIFSAGQ